MSDLDAGGTFFGLIVKPNKRYDSKVKETFRLSMACIEPSTVQDKVTSLFVEYESEEYIIANFDKKNLNANLDHGFSVGENVAFKVEGPGTVHLTGIIEADHDMMDTIMEESEEESELDESLDSSPLKRKKGDSNSSVKKMKIDKAAVNGKDDDESEDDSEDDSDDSEGETTLGDLDSTTNFAEEEESEDDDDSDDEEEEVSEDEDDSDEEVPSPKKNNGDVKQTPGQKKKEEVSTPKKDAKAQKQESKTPKQDGKTPKKDAKTPKQDMKTPKQDGKTPKPEIKTPKQDGKTPKQDGKTPKQDGKTPKQDGKTPKQDGKTLKQDGKTPKQDGKTPNPEAKTPKQGSKDGKDVNTPKSVKKTVKGGIQIEELKEGSGPECKPGKAVGMYYSGRLKSNNKQFDACISGKPFKFKLGKGEVIKGWDIGVNGLKVGGKRRLTIPPNMGYGSSGAPPDIPPNSTLVFDVECKYVH